MIFNLIIFILISKCLTMSFFVPATALSNPPANNQNESFSDRELMEMYYDAAMSLKAPAPARLLKAPAPASSLGATRKNVLQDSFNLRSFGEKQNPSQNLSKNPSHSLKLVALMEVMEAKKPFNSYNTWFAPSANRTRPIASPAPLKWFRQLPKSSATKVKVMAVPRVVSQPAAPAAAPPVPAPAPLSSKSKSQAAAPAGDYDTESFEHTKLQFLNVPIRESNDSNVGPNAVYVFQD